MRLSIDAERRRPVSHQVREQLARAIERGRLVPGERLPTVRELADTLRVAPNTVAKAYRALEVSGYLETRGRHGTFVAARTPRPVPEADRRLTEAAQRYARRGRQLGFTDEAIVRAARNALRDRPAVVPSGVARPS